MSEKFILEYPKLDNEIIIVKGFLNLKSVKMETGAITVLVGEQAAGKSILAKLQYFFWKYQRDLFDTEFSSKKTIASYNRSQVSEFFELFAVTNKNYEPFKIEYKSNDIEICLECTTAGYKPKITTSNFLQKLFMKAQNAHLRRSKLRRDSYPINRKEYEKNPEKHEKSRVAFRKLDRVLDEFNYSIPSVLYVPASRSFFSTIEDNVFAFLAEGRESLDPLIVQFGKFYESAKGMNHRRSKQETEKNGRRSAPIIKEILKGDFLQENNKDIIRNTWGDVELRHASSGQQEALPLILSLLYFPSMHRINQLLIIEEPEAHLFPTAQKRILEGIVRVSQNRSCSVLIATHSPYIPTCLNNEILIAQNLFAQNKGELLTVNAYYVSKGKTVDIYDKEDDLIGTNELDSASGVIMTEYYHALKEYDELNEDTEDNDKNDE